VPVDAVAVGESCVEFGRRLAEVGLGDARFTARELGVVVARVDEDDVSAGPRCVCAGVGTVVAGVELLCECVGCESVGTS
jgi:hypothetical protein